MKQLKFVVIFFVLIWQSASYAQDDRQFTVGIIPYLPAGEFVVADFLGLYEQEGLNVKSIYYTSTGDWVRALSNAKLDFSGLWNATQVDMYYRGSSAKRLALMSLDNDDYKMIVRANTSPESLKQKRVGVFSDYFGTHWFIHNYFRNTNLHLKDTVLVEMTNVEGYKNFQRGRVDALIFDGKYMDEIVATGEGVVAEIERDLYLSATTGGPSYFDTGKNVTQEELKKFLRAWVKAMIWIEDKNNHEAYKNMLYKAYHNVLELVDIENDDDYKKRDPVSMLIPLSKMYRMNKNMEAMFNELNRVRSQIGYEETRGYKKHDMYDNSLILEVLAEFGYAK